MSFAIHAVILNWHDPVRTINSIDALRAIPLVRHIWVVDAESDGSLAHEVAGLGFSQVSMIELSENVGFSTAVNAGLKRATLAADFVLCINTDASIDADSLAILANSLVCHADLGMVGPQIYSGQHLSSGGGRVNPWTLGIDESGTGDGLDFLTWACVLLRSEALGDVGLLREDFFMYWEDVDFGLRMGQSRWRIAAHLTAYAQHETSVSHQRAGNWISTYSAFGVVLMGRLHRGQFFLGSAFRILGRLTASLIRGDLPKFKAVWRGALLGIRHDLGRPSFPLMNQARLNSGGPGRA